MSNAATIRAWIYRHSPKARPAGKEVQFPCPSCEHKAHYFNPHKGVGYCHAASCQRVSTVESLEDIWGEVDGFTVGAREPEEVPAQVQLPKGCQPLVTMEDGKYMTKFPEAVYALEVRGVRPIDAYLFALQMDPEDDRLVIPVIDGGELVNYVSRAAWWYTGKTDSKRYMYAKGANTGDYFFNFQAVKQWSHLAIVENTFNAIWLRHHFPCTTAFGSHLSKVQVAKLAYRVRHVTLMWDRGAEARAREACEKLRANGIQAEYVEFAEDGKQPDNYPAAALLDAYLRSDAMLKAEVGLKGVPIGPHRHRF